MKNDHLGMLIAALLAVIALMLFYEAQSTRKARAVARPVIEQAAVVKAPARREHWDNLHGIWREDVDGVQCVVARLYNSGVAISCNWGALR